MNRILSPLLIGIVFFLAGCSRSADPLDWKIEAANPRELQVWFEKNMPPMPKALGRELAVCVNNIRTTLPPSRTGTPQEKEIRLCSRLHDRTVREILIEGNELAYRMNVARIQNLSNDVLRLTNLESPTGAQREQLEAMRDSLKQAKDELAQGEKRIAELRAATKAP